MIVFWRFLKDRRRSALWWSLGLGGGLLLSVAFYPAIKNQPSFGDVFEDMPEGIQKLVGAAGASLTSPPGFLNSQIFAQVLPIALIALGIGVGARAIAGAEDDGTLELMLANPVTRRRVAVERYLGAVTQVAFVGVVSTIALLAFTPVFQLTPLSIGNLLGACLAVTCFAIMHGSIAFALGAASGGRGNAMAGASAIAFAGFVVFGLVSSGVTEWARFLSPWWWYLSRNILAQGLPPEAVLAPLASSAALATIGVLRFERRDLRSS